MRINRKAFLIHINAGNDNNGNPRRGWFVYDSEGQFYGFLDEGYSGRGALSAAKIKNYVELMNNVPVSPSYYREALRYGY